jgi:hypothetical protein
MRTKLLNAVAASALVAALAGCGGGEVPSPSISLTKLSHEGFEGGATQLVAAPSLPDLLGLLHGVGVFPSLDECNRFRQFRAQCWLDVKDPGNSLMVAGLVDLPCKATDSTSATMSATTELTITVANSGDCGRGSGMAPLPFLSLMAIPLSALPADEITVRLLHTGVSVPVAKMMVDLRRPLNVHSDVLGLTTEVIAAHTTAMADAGTRVVYPGQVSLLAIGTNRWTDTALGCLIPGQKHAPSDARGYVVFLRGSDQPQLAMEYHVSGTTVAFCGRVAY